PRRDQRPGRIVHALELHAILRLLSRDRGGILPDPPIRALGAVARGELRVLYGVGTRLCRAALDLDAAQLRVCAPDRQDRSPRKKALLAGRGPRGEPRPALFLQVL